MYQESFIQARPRPKVPKLLLEQNNKTFGEKHRL